MEKIDIVIPWVDGSDPEWSKLKRKYTDQEKFANNEERFRDWDLLKYWFRGVEKFAPWVNSVHFITCGHLPKWLNTNHPKLHVVFHKEYIPEEYLPTFSSHPIELNLHRIEGLSEKFIYFNDDFFIINRVSPSDFFDGDIPRSTVGLSIPCQVGPEFGSTLLADYEVINRNFRSCEVVRQHFSKFINSKYGFKRNLQTILLLPYCTQFFPGFYNAHGPNAFLKSTFCEVWDKEEQKLKAVCSNKFRTPCDLNQYIFLWWQWCKGLVSAQDVRKLFTYLTVLLPDDQLLNAITNRITPMIAINDAGCDNFEQKKRTLQRGFDAILGEKSEFEL